MSDIKLFRLTSDAPTEVRAQSAVVEKSLQTLIERTREPGAPGRQAGPAVDPRGNDGGSVPAGGARGPALRRDWTPRPT